MASPTTVRTLTPSVATVVQISSASKPSAPARTTLPPPNRVLKAPQWALTCMSGGAHNCAMGKSGMRPASSSGSLIETLVEQRIATAEGGVE